MPRQLNVLSVRTVQAKVRPGYYCDGGGLYLQVSQSGSKSWIFRFRLHGRAREMGLGSLTAIGLAKARERAQECRAALAEGNDPIEARDAAQRATRLAQARSKTFKECAEAFILANRAGWKNKKHIEQWSNTLDTYCYPTLGKLPVATVATDDVMRVLEPMWHNKTDTAKRVRGRIEKILSWAKARGLRDGANPAQWRGHLDQMLPSPAKVARVQHHPAMPFDQVPGFMKKVRELQGVAPRALELIVLTATRTAEGIGARAAEFDLAKSVWTIPAERMKAGREHKVPLSRAAAAIAAAAVDGADESGALFANRAGAPLSNMACLAVLKRMGLDQFTVHGFRSSFRDWASERTSFPREVIEMSLAHAIGDKVEAAYRRGDLFEKRKKLMQAWADFCASTPMVATVHQIGKGVAHR
jgi:integrase